MTGIISHPFLKTEVSMGLSALSSRKVVIGIDPGLASVGYGVVIEENGRLVHVVHGCITTDSSSPSELRLGMIYSEISKLLEEFTPTSGAIEALYFFRNVSSALPVAEARGVIKLAFHSFSVPLSEYSPNAIKKAVCGTARADKRQVQEMVRLLIGLETIPKPDHAADALAAAICGIHSTLSKVI
jgi:crossover junction endodeoxyribonuclease RuvC